MRYLQGIAIPALYVFHDKKSTCYSKDNKRKRSPTKRFLQKFYSNLETEQQKLLQNEKEEVTMKKAFERIEAFLERYYKGIAPAYKM